MLKDNWKQLKTDLEDLLKHCDEYEERDKFEILDSTIDEMKCLEERGNGVSGSNE